MDTNRRNFLKGTAWMGAAALAAGCLNSRGGKVSTLCDSSGGAMSGFAAPQIRGNVRVGVVGLGSRGGDAARRLAIVPGVQVVAICDLVKERIDAIQTWYAQNGKPKAREYTGAEGYKRMCESDLDVIYNATPWAMHAPIGLYAMEHGKHALIEVPAAMTIDECWALVETSERTQKHCMQLENCCYGEMEMLLLNLCRKGLLGELVHGEGAYIHDLRSMYKRTKKDTAAAGLGGKLNRDLWRVDWNAKHHGNQYPTHGLGPIAQCMNINRGDRFEYLVSLESGHFNWKNYARAHFDAQSWENNTLINMADMNVTLIKTALGRSIMIQHDVSSPRPYSRINLLTGTKGIFWGMPYLPRKAPEVFKVGWETKVGAGVHNFFDAKKADEIRQTYKHPIWKAAGEIAKKVGGHGGMDFLMDLRWAYCLQNGLPLDMNVYDLAAWCSLCELTERSVNSHSMPQQVPDFTRGGWKTAQALGIEEIDTSKLDFNWVQKKSAT